MASALALLVLLVAYAASRPAPSEHVNELATCYERDNEDIESCLQDFWNNMKPHLAVGIPDMKIPALDPLKLDVLEFEDDGAVVNTKSNFTEVVILGAGEYETTAVKVDRKAATVTVKLFIPALYSSGLYDIKGTVMLMPVHGRGSFTLNLTNVEGSVVSHMVPHGKGAKADKIEVDFKVGSMTAALKGFPDADGETGQVDQALSDMINNNNDAILNDVKPKMSERISETMLALGATALVQIPAKAFIE